MYWRLLGFGAMRIVVVGGLYLSYDYYKENIKEIHPQEYAVVQDKKNTCPKAYEIAMSNDRKMAKVDFYQFKSACRKEHALSLAGNAKDTIQDQYEKIKNKFDKLKIPQPKFFGSGGNDQ